MKPITKTITIITLLLLSIIVYVGLGGVFELKI